MKLLIVLILITASTSFAQVKFNGNTNYIQKREGQLTSNGNFEHIFKIYENHKYLISLSNVLNVDLDHFENEIKEANVFTTLKIEF